MNRPQLPPRQQLAAPGKWPLVGEREPAPVSQPWSLAVSGCVGKPQRWTLAELSDLPQVACHVDIHCVTRWSMLGASFSGVRLEHLLELAQPTTDAKYVSFVAHSVRQHSTSLVLSDALQLGTLVATSYEGQPLPIEHGGPIRSIVPDRYFYKSVKWLTQIELLSQDRLGYWEAMAGYHNHADPWREERFIASTISKKEAAELLLRKDLSGRELLGLDGSGRELSGLEARKALLRNADFRRANLSGSVFDEANLSNARFEAADLSGASFLHADLEGANLCGANLRGADLRGASLFGATFVESDSGQVLAAILDSKTKFEDASLDGLTPAQADFIRSALASVRR